MNSLPTELNLKILHRVRDSTPTIKFSLDVVASMKQADAYNKFLLLMASLHRQWTALAQSELFHHIILADENRTRLLLKLLRKRGNGAFRTYAERASSIRLGYASAGYAQDYDDLKDHLDELAQYCPNIVEISCACVNTKFSDFQNFKRLDRLNVYGGRHDGSGSFSLSITELSVNYCQLSEPLYPSFFPLLRHLICDSPSADSLQSVLPLLPQITSLIIGKLCPTSQIDRMISASTSLTTISISDSQFRRFTDESHNIIKARLEMIRVIISRYGGGFSKLADCVTGSMVLKKVILDGLMPIIPSARANKIAELTIVVEACKKKKTVELWTENFSVDGKVDLDADVATSSVLA